MLHLSRFSPRFPPSLPRFRTFCSPNKSIQLQCQDIPKSQTVHIKFSTGEQASFGYKWLRESIPKTLHPLTKQRSITAFLLGKENYQPQNVKIDGQTNSLQIEWKDGNKSEYPSDWLLYQTQKPLRHHEVIGTNTTLWENNESFHSNREAPIISYKNADLSSLLQCLSKDGFVLVKDTPTDPQATIDLVSLIGQPQSNNIWGSWWDYTVDTAKTEGQILDTAYTGDMIQPHTDGTYLYDTPGLQVFHVLSFEGSSLPLTSIVDAFQVASAIKEKDPEAYQFLSTFPFEWYFVSDTHNLRTYKPIVTLDSKQQIEQIRFNDLDRAPPPPLSQEQLDLYYKSIELFSSHTNNPKYQFKLKLEPGTVLIVNNWRVLHARSTFTGKRRICGCYVAVDQFRSQLTVNSQCKPFI